MTFVENSARLVSTAGKPPRGKWLLFGPNYHPKRAAGEEYGEIKALCTFKSLKGLLRKELA